MKFKMRFKCSVKAPFLTALALKKTVVRGEAFCNVTRMEYPELVRKLNSMSRTFRTLGITPYYVRDRPVRVHIFPIPDTTTADLVITSATDWPGIEWNNVHLVHAALEVMGSYQLAQIPASAESALSGYVPQYIRKDAPQQY